MTAVSAPTGTLAVRLRDGAIAASRRTITMQWHTRPHDDSCPDAGLNENQNKEAVGGEHDAE